MSTIDTPNTPNRGTRPPNKITSGKGVNKSKDARKQNLQNPPPQSAKSKSNSPKSEPQGNDWWRPNFGAIRRKALEHSRESASSNQPSASPTQENTNPSQHQPRSVDTEKNASGKNLEEIPDHSKSLLPTFPASDEESINDLILNEDEQSAQGLPPLDINAMQWTVELYRLQRVEKSLGRKIARLTQNLENSDKENSRRGNEITSLENNVCQLEDKVQSLEGKIANLWSERENLQQEKITTEWEHKNKIKELNERISNLEIQCREGETSNLKLQEDHKKDIEKLKEANKRDRNTAQDLRKQIEELEEFSKDNERKIKQEHKNEMHRLQEENKARERGLIEEHQRKIHQLEEDNESSKVYLSQVYKGELQKWRDADNASQRQYEILQTENQRLGINYQNLHKEQARLNNAYAVLNDQQSLSRAEINSLEDRSKRQTSKIDSLSQALIAAKTDMESLSQDLDRAIEESTFHRNDAEKLRAHIAKAEIQQSPLHDEDFYIQNFGEIKTDIESWIARNAKANATQSLSDRQEASLLKYLEESGEHGQRASEYLRANNRIQIWYSTARWRIPLARHIVAAFIFAYVFQPFVVGLPASLSEVLEWIDQDIMSQESQFSKVLSFRQSLGKGAVRYAQTYGQEQQEDVIARFVKMLLVLFPNATESDIKKGVSRFINKAIKLKYAMAEEQAIYYCYWVNGGERYDENLVDVDGEEKGIISICIFPGLARRVENDDGKLIARAVKATALLQTAFANK